ncbi:MAG TPA: condensation domain-containing protein, partial [Thermoanaerobaculia bacterium]|nr:condensation domain-containing protein [Thermoanaerobaculia bacterium]
MSGGGEARRAELAHLLCERAQVRRYPLSFGQERLWFLEQLDAEGSQYNVTAATRVRGALDVERLGWAVGEVRRRHEILRSRVEVVEGVPLQRVDPWREEPLRVVRASSESAAMTIVRAESDRRFALQQEAPLRALVVQHSAESIVVLTMHHIASDGWSVELLHGELSALYASGKAESLPPLPIQYGDYARWQRERLTAELEQREIGWWREQIGDAPRRLELPTDRRRPAVRSYAGARYARMLDQQLRATLETTGRREDVTLYMLLLAGWSVLLGRYSNQEQLLVGSAMANRGRVELEPLIGFFANTVVLRADLRGNPTVRELLGRTRETALRTYGHQDVPFERVVEGLESERDLSTTPLVQAMLTLQNAGGSGALRLGEAPCERLLVESDTSKFDLTLSVDQNQAGLRLLAEYSTELFEPSTIERMLRHFEAVLQQMIARPDARIADIELLGEEERREAIERWSATRRAFPVRGCLHDRFEEQARRRPDALALRCGAESLTYAELNARANRLARSLRARGAGVESRVGICMERSAAMVVAILGVLKAGAAYVPLDPAYPRERLDFMIADAGVEIVLTALDDLA